MSTTTTREETTTTAIDEVEYERQDADYDVDFVDNPIFDTDQPEPDRIVFLLKSVFILR